jgi:hypothetical protein
LFEINLNSRACREDVRFPGHVDRSECRDKDSNTRDEPQPFPDRLPVIDKLEPVSRVIFPIPGIASGRNDLGLKMSFQFNRLVERFLDDLASLFH